MFVKSVTIRIGSRNRAGTYFLFYNADNGNLCWGQRFKNVDAVRAFCAAKEWNIVRIRSTY